MQDSGKALLTRAEMMGELHALGFRHYPCSRRAWKTLSVMESHGSMLCFLIGKRSVDFKYFSGAVVPVKFRPDGAAYVYGGTIIRNYYRESGVNLHERTLTIARAFAATGGVDRLFLDDVGTSLANYRRRVQSPTRRLVTDESGMADVYDALSCGDGEAVYLSDGMWLGANGSMDDRGR